MDKLKETIAYIAKNYPVKDDISNARLTKMVYLADWHQSIKHSKQITPIKWYFDNYGPYVPDIYNKAAEYPDTFSIVTTNNMFGTPKTIISITEDSYEPSLDIQEKESIDHIIEVTKTLNWKDFIKLVYSTYPVATSNRHTYLNLVEKSYEYILT